MPIIEMSVNMDCPGCESKIRRALRKLDGVNEIDIDMNLQKVTVLGWVDQNDILKAVRKTGKSVELWNDPHDYEYSTFYQHYYDISKNYVINNSQHKKVYHQAQLPQTFTTSSFSNYDKNYHASGTTNYSNHDEINGYDSDVVHDFGCHK